MVDLKIYFEVIAISGSKTCFNKGDNHLQDWLLDMLEKLHIPKGEIMQLKREVSTSKVVGHFGVVKIIASLQR